MSWLIGDKIWLSRGEQPGQHVKVEVLAHQRQPQCSGREAPCSSLDAAAAPVSIQPTSIYPSAG